MKLRIGLTILVLFLLGVQMSFAQESEAVTTFEEFWAAIAAGDKEAARAMLADEADVSIEEAAALDEAGESIGPAEFERWIEEQIEAGATVETGECTESACDTNYSAAGVTEPATVEVSVNELGLIDRMKMVIGTEAEVEPTVLPQTGAESSGPNLVLLGLMAGLALLVVGIGASVLIRGRNNA